MPQDQLRFLAEGGETGAMIRATDWASTPLGPPRAWPGPLRTLVGVMLSANQPMFLVWGPARTMLYNDDYAEILAAKHPAALGRDMLEVWSEIRADLVPIVEAAYAGRPVQMDDITLTMMRRGYPEETHFAFSYTPVRDEAGAVAGFFCACTETTGEVLAARRQAFRLTLEERLRDLADPADAIAAVSAALGRHLAVNQVAYAEVEPGGQSALIEREWNDGTMAANARRHRLDDYGPALIADLRRGITIAIPDIRLDPRTSSPAALAAFAQAAVLGFLDVPILRAGRLIAILAIHSAVPRPWSAADIGLAEEIAVRTRDAVERVRAEAALRDSEARLRLALDASGMVGLFDWRVGEDLLFADARFARLFGVDPDRAATGAPIAEFMRAIHPDDVARVEAAVARSIQAAEPYEAEYRVLRSGGEVRWVVARGAIMREGRGPLRLAGTVVDIHARKLAEERQALLSREVDHRAKNALAVVLAALQLTRAPDLPGYVRAITGRVAALARAQNLLAADHWAGADLRTMLAAELDAFLADGAAGAPLATLAGPVVVLPVGAAQPLAMAVHELATNATKHGALSVPGGRVAVTWSLEGGPAGTLALRWAETGGPPVPAPPSRRGFGSRVLDGTVRGQLGGEVSLEWNPAGLVCDITVPLARIAGDPPDAFLPGQPAANGHPGPPPA